MNRPARPAPTLSQVPVNVAAELAHVSFDQIEHWIDSGRLRAEVIKKVRYVDLDAVEALRDSDGGPTS